MEGLGAPLAEGDEGEVRQADATGVQAGDGVDDLFADELAAAVVAAAADAGGPGEVQAGGGDSDEAAVPAVQFRVVRLARAGGLDGIEGGALRDFASQLITTGTSISDGTLNGRFIPIVMEALSSLSVMAWKSGSAPRWSIWT